MGADLAAGGGTGFWAPGTQILWRYRENGGARFHIARPVTVARDDADLLAVWLAPGTECVKPVLADGTPVHGEPLETRYTKPRAVRVDALIRAITQMQPEQQA